MMMPTDTISDITISRHSKLFSCLAHFTLTQTHSLLEGAMQAQ